MARKCYPSESEAPTRKQSGVEACAAPQVACRRVSALACCTAPAAPCQERVAAARRASRKWGLGERGAGECAEEQREGAWR